MAATRRPARAKAPGATRAGAAAPGEAARGTARSGARTAPPAAPTPGSYHHGDLANALLAATESLLDEAGVEGFTLREVARRAGVSHGAPAHHFGDVRGLLSAFTAQSFGQLAEAMAARRAASMIDPFEQLVATGLAYVEYAVTHRARFQLMFRTDRLDPDHAALVECGGQAYGHLVDCIAAIDTGSGREAQARRQQKTALAWSIVHGYATLLLDNREFAAGLGSRAQALALLEAMLRRSREAFLA